MISRIIVMALLAGLASILANQSIAVFNDGLRPLIPEYLEKRMDRKSLLATSFALSFGLVTVSYTHLTLPTKRIV